MLGFESMIELNFLNVDINKFKPRKLEYLQNVRCIDWFVVSKKSSRRIRDEEIKKTSSRNCGISDANDASK